MTSIKTIQTAVLVVLATLLAQEAGASVPRRLKVATYNVWGLPRPLLQKPGRLGLIHKYIGDLQADVITFQETFDRKTRVLSNILGYPHIAYGPGPSDNRMSSGLLVVSKWPIVATHEMKYASCSGTDCFANKGVLHARIDVPGLGEVDVFTSHLNAAGKSELRSEQARELRAFVERHSGDRPMFVTGDFNFKMDSVPYFEMLSEGRFRDAHAEYRTHHQELSLDDWHAYTMDPMRNSNMSFARPFAKPARIDYVWLKDAACVKTEVERSELFFDEKIEGLHLSDHFGVTMDLVIDSSCGA